MGEGGPMTGRTRSAWAHLQHRRVWRLRNTSFPSQFTSRRTCYSGRKCISLTSHSSLLQLKPDPRTQLRLASRHRGWPDSMCPVWFKPNIARATLASNNSTQLSTSCAVTECFSLVCNFGPWGKSRLLVCRFCFHFFTFVSFCSHGWILLFEESVSLIEPVSVCWTSFFPLSLSH